MEQNGLSDPRVLAGFSVPAVRRLKAVLPNTISLWPRIALHLPARQTSDMDLNNMLTKAWLSVEARSKNKGKGTASNHSGELKF